MIQIRPVSDLRNKFPDIEKAVGGGEPVFLTKNGYGAMVVLSLEAKKIQEKVRMKNKKTYWIIFYTVLALAIDLAGRVFATHSHFRFGVIPSVHFCLRISRDRCVAVLWDSQTISSMEFLWNSNRFTV